MTANKQSHFSLIIGLQRDLKASNARLLAAQKDIKQLKDAAYADHRLIEKMNDRIDILFNLLEDDGK